MQEPILTVNNLGISFIVEEKEFKAVDSISFSLSKGEVLGIVGESGSGKSVTSLAIMQLLPSPPAKYKHGEILFGGNNKIDLLRLNNEGLNEIRGKKIAMIFQEPMTSLNPVLTCGFQVMEAIIENNRLNKHEARKKTLELFKEVELPEPEILFDKYPFQISGGQKQRVMIAMAISGNPDILIADEPTTALDVLVQKNILSLLKALQRKYGMSIIFITHDLGIVSEIADRVMVMYKGKIIEEGITREILSNPVQAYTRGLLSCRPVEDARPKKLLTVTDFINEENTVSRETILNRQEIVTEEERKVFHQKIYETVPLLQVKGLVVDFVTKQNFFGKPSAHFRAVNNLSFDVFHGETLGLVGGSGCGKTTLGRAIMRLIDSQDGEIIYGGKNLRNLKTKEMRQIRKKIQIIFQDPYSSLNPRMTTGQIIAEPMLVNGLHRTKKECEAKVYELMEKVSLESSHFYRYPHEFSGGQRQRIGIARALALEPEFIICDESVSALDVSVQAQVLNLLNDLKREFDLTYIFISHDLSVVRYMSDRIIVMNHGDIEEVNEADFLYRNPETEYTKSLINAIPGKAH